MTPKQREHEELMMRLGRHGDLIDQQHDEIKEIEADLFATRAAAAIAWIGLVILAYHSIVSPLLECRL